MAQKVVLKLLTMTDDKTKQKAIEAAADIYGVDSIAADLKEQKLTVIGEMDAVAVVKKLKKVGKVDLLSIGPAKEEKKEEKKAEQPPAKPAAEQKKEEKKEAPPPAAAAAAPAPAPAPAPAASAPPPSADQKKEDKK